MSRELTIIEVSFIAYGRACREYYADETWEYIHNDLQRKCNTYEVIAINEITAEPKFLPLETLRKFKEPAT